MIYSAFLVALIVFSYLEVFHRIALPQKKVIIAVFIALWAIIACIRTVPAADYAQYKETFDVMVSSETFADVLFPSVYLYEPLFDFLLRIVKFCIPSFPVFMLVEYLLCAVLMYKAIMYFGSYVAEHGNGNGYELTAYFIFWGLYMADIFIIRSTIALCICVLAFKYIQTKRIVPFIVCVVVAGLFHVSAFVFLVAYPVFHLKLSFTQKMLIAAILLFLFTFGIWLVAALLSSFMPTKVAERISGYVQGAAGDEIGGGTGMSASTVLVSLVKGAANIGVLMVVCYLVYRKTMHKGPDMDGFINNYVLGSVIYLGTMFQSFAFARISIFFNIVQIPILMAFMSCYGERRQRQLAWAFLVAYISARFIVNLWVDSSMCLPLTTIFNGTL